MGGITGKKRADRSILYEDSVSHVEEISLIEENYLWQNVLVYVDDTGSMRESLVFHSPSFIGGGRSIGAYMRADDPSTISVFGEILKQKGNVKVHLQASVEAQPSVDSRWDG